jgi:hypothetical protein
LAADVVETILTKWKWADNGYHFHSQQPAGVFNTARIMHGCANVAKQYATGARTASALLDFAPDPNTKAADSTLQLLARSPHAASVFVDALDRSNIPSRLQLTGSSGFPLPRFRLADLSGELNDSNRSALLSFLWCLGGSPACLGKKAC